MKRRATDIASSVTPGDTEAFHSDLHLMADSQLGFFISYNSAGKGEGRARKRCGTPFSTADFPYEVPKADPVTTSAQDIQNVSGHYIVSRRADTTIMKVLNVVGEAKVLETTTAR